MNSRKNRCSVEQLNEELNEFYEYLKRKRYKDDEIRKIFSPLTSKIKKAHLTLYWVLFFVIFVTFLYLLSYIEYFSWIFSAVGRILLIKILPYYDWTHLKYEKCLISSPNQWLLNKAPLKQRFNCDLCENIQKIDSFETLDEETLQEKYIELHVPLIMTTGLDHWLDHKNFTETILKHDDFYFSRPCSVSSNIVNEEMDAGKILERVKLFDSFFLHFQNCDQEAKGIFRMYTFRPDYLPEELAPILYNWIIWNKSYNTTNFKYVPLVEDVGVFGQIVGKTLVRLTPRKNCEFVCPVVNLEMNPGESVVFTSLWDLEYKPSVEDESLAVILELNN